MFGLVWFGATKVTVWADLASINERVDRSRLINEHIYVWFGAGLVRMPARQLGEADDGARPHICIAARRRRVGVGSGQATGSRVDEVVTGHHTVPRIGSRDRHVLLCSAELRASADGHG